MAKVTEQERIEAESFLRERGCLAEELTPDMLVEVDALAQLLADKRENTPMLWGAGDGWKEAKPYRTTFLGAFGGERPPRPVHLFHGKHPHSRRDNSTYAKAEGWSEPEGFNGHDVLVDIIVRSANYLKTSHLSGDEIRRSASAEILFNGRCVYAIGGRDPAEVAIRAATKIPLLREHTADLYEGEGDKFPKIDGRKIYYRDVPAVIERYIPDQGALIVRPETGYVFPAPAWVKAEKPADRDPLEEEERRTFDKPDLFSPSIWWWRD